MSSGGHSAGKHSVPFHQDQEQTRLLESCSSFRDTLLTNSLLR